jgi:hypothetical protein
VGTISGFGNTVLLNDVLLAIERRGVSLSIAGLHLLHLDGAFLSILVQDLQGTAPVNGPPPRACWRTNAHAA